MQRASWGEGSPLHQQHVCSRCCYTRNIFFPASKTRGKRMHPLYIYILHYILHPLESTSPSQRIAHPHLQLQVSSDTGSLVPSCNTWGTYCPKPTLTHGHRRPGAGCQVVFCSISWGGIFLRRQILEHNPWT